MGKILRLFFILLFFNIAVFADINTHKQLQSKLVEAIITNNNVAKKSILEKLIKSSKELKLNSFHYEKQLNDMKLAQIPLNQTYKILNSKYKDNSLSIIFDKDINIKDLKISRLYSKGRYFYIHDIKGIVVRGANKNYKKKNSNFKISIAQLNKKTARIVFSDTKKLNLNLTYSKNVLNFFLPHQETKQKTIKKEKIKKTTKIKQKYDPNKTFRLLKINLDNEELSLKLNKDIAKNNVRHFILEGKNIYRYVYDIKGALTQRNFKGNLNKLVKISIAQFDKSTFRIVFTSNKKIDIDYNVENNFLTFGLKTKNNSKTIINGFDPSKKIIVIDPGHGGEDNGATGYKKIREKNVVLDLSKAIQKELKKQGYKVYLTRTKDVKIDLSKRTIFANLKNADIFISIHANAAPNKSKYDKMKGIETFFLSKARSKRAVDVARLENQAGLEGFADTSKNTFLKFLNHERIISSNKLAIDIHKGVLSKKGGYKIFDGGVREAPFLVLVGALMPAILLETGYLTNKNDAIRLTDKKYQKEFAKGIALGINNYFKNNP